MDELRCSMLSRPNSFLGMVEVNEKVADRWGRGEGPDGRPLLHMDKVITQLFINLIMLTDIRRERYTNYLAIFTSQEVEFP